MQTWRASDWEEGHYSIVTFVLSKAKNGCLLEFTQKEVPLEHFTAIKQGWVDFYWIPMRKMSENVQ